MASEKRYRRPEIIPDQSNPHHRPDGTWYDYESASPGKNPAGIQAAIVRYFACPNCQRVYLIHPKRVGNYWSYALWCQKCNGEESPKTQKQMAGTAVIIKPLEIKCPSCGKDWSYGDYQKFCPHCKKVENATWDKS